MGIFKPRTRREFIKRALAGTAYVAPVIVSGVVPSVVSASPPPVLGADLSLTAAVDNSGPAVGDTITITLTLVNGGLDTATNVTVRDTLPAGLTFVSALPSQGVYDPATGIWSVGTLAPLAGSAAVKATVASTATLALRATVTGSGRITDTATITHSDQPDPNSGNNTASVTITPGALSVDLAVTKTVDNPAAPVGTNVTFTVTVKNNGPSNATGVQVTDHLPAGLTFVSADSAAYASGTGVWNIGNLANGATATLHIVATVAVAGTKTNTASITASTPQNSGANGSASAMIVPGQPSADLAVTKTVDNATPNNNDTITFTVGVKNNGPSDTTGVQVTDRLPPGLNFVSATPSQGTYDSGTGLWSVGSLANQAAATLTLKATVSTISTVTNTAAVTHSDLPDSATGNNTASRTITPRQADIAVLKSVDNPTPTVGNTIVFTVTVINNGPSAATNVAVTDQLPSGVTYVSSAPSQGAYDHTTGIWTVGALAVDAQATLGITTTVNSASKIMNAAYVSHSDQYDPNSGNNYAATGANPNAADLILLKTVDNPNPSPGTPIMFTVTVRNSGPATATGVTVTDQLPGGIAFTSATASQGDV